LRRRPRPTLGCGAKERRSIEDCKLYAMFSLRYSIV